MAGLVRRGQISASYHPLEANAQGWLWSQQLGLYLGIHQERLRFFSPEETLIPTPEEAAEAEGQTNAKLRAKLRELGVDPDTL